jgi:hypothetical protein
MAEPWRSSQSKPKPPAGREGDHARRFGERWGVLPVARPEVRNRPEPATCSVRLESCTVHRALSLLPSAQLCTAASEPSNPAFGSRALRPALPRAERSGSRSGGPSPHRAPRRATCGHRPKPRSRPQALTASDVFTGLSSRRQLVHFGRMKTRPRGPAIVGCGAPSALGHAASE